MQQRFDRLVNLTRGRFNVIKEGQPVEPEWVFLKRIFYGRGQARTFWSSHKVELDGKDNGSYKKMISMVKTVDKKARNYADATAVSTSEERQSGVGSSID